MLDHPCPIVVRSVELVPQLRQVILHRAEEGKQKYGQYLSQNRRTEREKAVHKLQEDLDGLAYALWEVQPDQDEITVRVTLIFRTLAKFRDLTFAELTFKEGHSGRDYAGILTQLAERREALLRGDVTPADQQRLDAIDALRAAIVRQDTSDRIREQAGYRLAQLDFGGGRQ